MEVELISCVMKEIIIPNDRKIIYSCYLRPHRPNPNDPPIISFNRRKYMQLTLDEVHSVHSAIDF